VLSNTFATAAARAGIRCDVTPHALRRREIGLDCSFGNHHSPITTEPIELLGPRIPAAGHDFLYRIGGGNEPWPNADLPQNDDAEAVSASSSE
jgi:hypothetical protein